MGQLHDATFFVWRALVVAITPKGAGQRQKQPSPAIDQPEAADQRQGARIGLFARGLSF